MPESKDKKITYKILTSEQILKDDFSLPQEVHYKDENVEIINEQTVNQSSDAFIPSNIEKQDISLESKIEKEIPKEEIFYIPKDLQKIETTSSEHSKQEITRQSIFFSWFQNFKFIKIVYLFIPLILITGFVLFFMGNNFSFEKKKTNDKNKPVLSVLNLEQRTKKEENPQSYSEIATSSLQATNTTNTTNTTDTTDTTDAKKEVITSSNIFSNLTTTLSKNNIQNNVQPATVVPNTFVEKSNNLISDLSFIKYFDTEEINFKNNNILSSWEKELENFLLHQRSKGTKININLVYNGKNISSEFILNYFLKPTLISKEKFEEFKNNLTGNYFFIIYYGYTRKYPILIFEVKDKDKAKSFNQEWEKLSMKDDLKTLFLSNKPPETNNKFMTKEFKKFSYRILDFGNNFQIIWSSINNLIIYSSTEDGIKEILSFLK